MLDLHYIFEGSQSYNLDPNICYLKSPKGVRITNFKVLQALSNLGTSKILLFGQPKPSILLPLEEGTIQNSSVASVNTPCCSVITTHVEKVSCDEPRPGSSKDLEESRSLLPKPQSTFTIQNRYYYSVSFFKVSYIIRFLKVV